MQSQDKIFLNEDAKALFFIHIIPATFKWYFEYFLLHYFKRSTRCLFSKNKKWSVSPVSFHGKLERNIALTRTVKDREFKCFFCDEEEEVIILRKKAFILKNLIRHNFNFISQLVTSNKVKIADMIYFNNENVFFCSSFLLIQRTECGFSHTAISLSRSSGFAFSYAVTVSGSRGCFFHVLLPSLS